LFRRSSGRYAEHKTLGIPFRTVPQRRKKLEILYHGTKKSKLSEFCSEPFHGRENNSKLRSMEHKKEATTSGNSVPRNKNRSKLSEFSSEGFSDENILFAGAGFFV
jgi:hypothetical protein